MQAVNLSERAMLAYIAVGLWSARKLDKKSSKKVTTDASATADAARVHKHLLASADEKLKAIQHVAGKARRLLDEHSSPWDDAGNRLVSNAKAIWLIGELRGIEQEFHAAVDDFVLDYPMLRAQAVASLGSLANLDDYPEPDRVREKFSMRMSFTPLPQNFDDMRMGMSPEQAALLRQHYEARIKEQHSRALMSVWERLREQIKHVLERLEPDEDGKRKRYRNTMMDNLRETCAMVKSLNVFEDAELELVRNEVERTLCAFETEQLRDNDLLAEQVRSDANAILEKMKSLLGE